MRNEENISHIVRDKRAITSLSLTKNICFLLIQHLSEDKNTNNKFLSLINH